MLLFFLRQPDTFECCVVSPIFSNAAQRSFAAPLPAAWPVLKDAYIAFAEALKLFREGSDREGGIIGNAHLRHASSAMETVRSLPGESSQDAAVCLTLGMALAMFVYYTIGIGVSATSQYCLSRTAPFITNVVLDPDNEPLLSYLVLMEIMDCFAHRRKPTLRIPPRQYRHADRHLGLCIPLLPYFYDFCVINHSLASATDANLMAHLIQQLDGIHAAVEAWQLSQPDDLIQQFEAPDVIHLLA